MLVREITAEAGGTCGVEQTASGGKVIWSALPLAPVVTSPRSAPSAL